METATSGNIIRFRSRIGILTLALTIFSIVIMLFPALPLFLQEINLVNFLILGIIIGLSGLLLWMVFGTWYELSGWATGLPQPLKELIVKYGKYDEIYFSPKTNETFIKAILKIKPNIKIIEQE